MFNLLRAEWMKIVRNRMLMAFTVWIFPIGLAAFFLIMTVNVLLIGDANFRFALVSSGSWIEDTTRHWGMLAYFPTNILSRLLPMAFMAVVFAGEYQSQTWKNIIPRGRRIPILLSKMLAVSLLFLLVFVVISVVIGVGQAGGHLASGEAYGPYLSTDVLWEYLDLLWKFAMIALYSILVIVGYAALAAVVTRSLVGAILVGGLLAVFEPATALALTLLEFLFGIDGLINLFRFTPTYNLNNLYAWLFTQTPFTDIPGNFTVEPSMLFSFIVLTIWVLGLAVLSAIIFQQQDITS
ncbi:MAG: ABC transporter permease [Anaerolineales bacterium]|nr:ABC transporter permease [Anaerolineales bacterium]